MHCTSCCQVGYAMCNFCSLWVDSLNFSWSNADATGRKTFPFFYAFSPTTVKNTLFRLSAHISYNYLYIKKLSFRYREAIKNKSLNMYALKNLMQFIE